MNWPWKRTLAGAVVALVAVLYLTGSLDNLLYKVGLNLHPCGQNAFGAVFCGSALTQYNARIREAEHQAQVALQPVTTTTQTSTASTPAVAASTAASTTFKSLPDSTQLQVSITVEHDCGSETSCVWYAEAAQYPAGVRCPRVFDITHDIWNGSVASTSETERGTVAFQPAVGDVRVEVCAYAHDEIVGDQLGN